MSSSSLSASATLCETAMDICYACTPFILDAPFCANAISSGNGNAGDVEDAAQSLRDAGQQLGQARDELAGLVNSIPASEWQSTDRQLYEQTATQYLQQLNTSAESAEAAGDMLTVAAAAIFTFAGFAMGVAAALAAAATGVAAGDATIVGAPEAEAAGAEAGAAALEALEDGNAVLLGALSGIAGSLGIGAAVDAGIQVGQGDTAAAGDFTQAVVYGLQNALEALPQELVGKAQDKLVDAAHEAMSPESDGGDGGDSSGGGSGDGGADG